MYATSDATKIIKPPPPAMFALVKLSAPGRTRTCDPELRRLLLSPLSYEGMSDHRHGRQWLSQWV
jgi:hypothetical protein